MNKQEQKQQLEAIIKLAVVAICAILYAYGGSGCLMLRRFTAPTLCVLAMLAFSRDWRCLLQLPLMFGALSLGYGGTTLVWLKCVKRGIFGLANGLAGSIYDLLNKRFLITALWIGILVAAFVVLGVWNGLPNARTEELFLGFLIFFKPIMSARPKKVA